MSVMTRRSEAGERPARGGPRLGFVGVGWIGRHRMEAIAGCGAGRIVAIADACGETARAAAQAAPDAAVCGSLDEVLAAEPDGVVIATPSAMHAAQAITALERGAAVFCQKPLARTAEETRRVVDAARAARRLLAVDLSYRHTEGARRIRELIRGGELGEVYAVDLTFHNAYGPDKAWFYDPALSGGGCVIDLGIHLVDLALWMLGFPEVERSRSRLYAKGTALAGGEGVVEDYATAQLELATGATVRLACSWHAHAGRDAVIEATFFGSEGGASMRNIDGSFYDFQAERFRGTTREPLAAPPDAWGGRAAVEWARRLAEGEGFDPSARHLVQVAEVIDGIYGRGGAAHAGGERP